MTAGRAGAAAGWVLRHSDATLAIAVAGIVAMMILPLPTWLLDILLASNISVAVVLLLLVLSISEPLAIATFPTILLLTTLYRLALNVSSTRLILLQADAGHVIDSFGRFVVAGNYVVGGVVFLILTIIQFIVIAKGSERVAEVAARFTLDAMPGKQMSIDADLRAGLVDAREARRRRSLLEREAQFYGAMDGGMRFVKGDAIAGIVITVVNICAGLLVGVLQMGMAPGEAARTFTLLTIGDGLVSQIPALVISTSAGIVITRVASEEPGAQLGADVARQLVSQPRALAVAAVLLLAVGLVPGMPMGPFWALGIFLGFLAWSAASRRRAALPAAATGAAAQQAATDTSAAPSELLCAVSVELAGELAAGGEGGPEWMPRLVQERVAPLRERLFESLGLRLPPVHIRTSPSPRPGHNFVVSIGEVPASRGTALQGRVFAAAPPEALAAAGIEAAAGPDPRGEGEGGWVAAGDRGRAAARGAAETMDAADYVVACVERSARAHAGELLGMQAVQDLLDALEATRPALVRGAVPKPVDLPLLTDVMRRLVSEGVSLRHLERILETLVAWAGHERDPVTLTELVRASLSRAITGRHESGEGRMDVYLLSPVIEEAVRASIHKTPAGSFLALAPELARDVRDAVARELGPASARGRRPAVIVTQSDVRRYVRKLIEAQHPACAVLSYQEIAPGTTLVPLGEIRIGT